MNQSILSSIVGLSLIATPAVRAQTSTAAPPKLKDKTLVAWVAPADLANRGGSALTIDDQRSHFDGIIFSELTPAKWMAGSDTFSRTQRPQNYPAETADAKTFVQIAIVYKGSNVSLFRNGEPLSDYKFPGAPREFGPQAMILMGKRHDTQMDKSHFAGAIDDARIYDRALTVNEIQGLKANEASEVKPWAWWTFEKDAKELTGRYPKTELTGGAKLENGKLIVDGKEGNLRAETGVEYVYTPETPARPAQVPDNWVTYHLAHPGPGNAIPGDPNCAFYWKGRYHLHYIYTHQDGFAFAHVSSDDMVRWKWHQTVLTPPVTGHGMFSGTGFFTKEGRPAIIYHGQGSGRNQVAIALDDQLDKWSKPVAINARVLPGQDGSKIANWDPDAWLDGDTYYALSGGIPGSGKPATLFKSSDLKNWDYLGLFLSEDMPDVQKDEDISCPNFFKIGNKHMLLCISHNKGCRYYLGDWKNEKFVPDFHARMNWHSIDFFAPESLLTADGRRVMWAWCELRIPQTGIQSLPRELSLPEDGVLRIKPLRELEKLRFDEKSEGNFTIAGGSTKTLEQISGDTIEFAAEITAKTATAFGVQVHCDQNGKGGLPITVTPAGKTLEAGSTKAPFELKAGERVQLRVFLDKHLVEVFANDRQALLVSHKTSPDKLRVSFFANGGEIEVANVKGWKMKSIYEPAQ